MKHGGKTFNEDRGAVDAHERKRNYLSPFQMDQLVKGAKNSRNPERNQALILMLYRHGLRETELCRAKLSQLDLATERIWVARFKEGLSTDQPVVGLELRLLKWYLQTRRDTLPWLFVSER